MTPVSARPRPSEKNDFLAAHVAVLRDSLRRCSGIDLVDPGLNPQEAARLLFYAPFAVVSHDTAKDPVFNYANQTALNLFDMNWEEFTSLPSRLSAEPVKQADRERLLDEVRAHGFVDDYSGVRISRRGRRFLIEDVLIWNLTDASGVQKGQAALIRNWKDL